MTDQDTRHRILTAAAKSFVENGFQKATVRGICREAGANVAAVNYHFRDKKGLYGAVIDYAMAQKPEVADDPKAPCKVRLRTWVSTLVYSCISQEPDLLSQIMTNEMTNPTGFLAVIVEKMVAPKMGVLGSIISDCLGAQAEPKRVQLIAMSVAGQALLYDHCRPVVDMMMPEMDYSDQCLEELIEHITQASLGMIEAFREKQNAE